MLTARATKKYLTTANKEAPSYMPIHLKGVLASIGISQEQWANSVTQTKGRVQGKPLSHTAAAQILNWNIWPKLTERDHLKRQTESILRGANVPDVLIRTVWDEDLYDENRHKHPLGVHATSGKRKHQPDHEPVHLEVEMLTTAAKKRFEIFRDPFVEDVQSPDDVFLSSDQRYIREAMYSTAKHGGFLAVVGESGSGKTTLRRDLLERIAREKLQVAVIQPRAFDKAALTASSICEAIVRDLSPQQKLRQTLEGKARQAETILMGSGRGGNAHVLLIEEAHDLSLKTLKLLKRFWELEDGFKKLLSIILVGQPELKGMLDARLNYEAREVINRCEIAELMPLNGNLEEYLALKFKRIGKKPGDVFDKDAYDAMRAKLTMRRREGGGVISMLYPLVVNNLVTKAMNACAAAGVDKVDADVIRGI